MMEAQKWNARAGAYEVYGLTRLFRNWNKESITNHGEQGWCDTYNGGRI